MSNALTTGQTITKNILKGLVRVTVGTAAASAAMHVVETALDRGEENEDATLFENLSSGLGIASIGWAVQSTVGQTTDKVIDNIFDVHFGNETYELVELFEDIQPKKKETED